MTRRRRSMGWVSGPVQLFPHQTVLEQLTTASRLGGARRRRVKLHAEVALNDEGLQHLGSAYPSELSPADRVRVAFARAYCHNPSIVIALDPFEGVEASDRASLRAELLANQARQARTILFVTGDSEDAIAVADQVAAVFDGSLLQVDSPADLLARPFDDRVTALLGANRGLRRLQFATIDTIEPDDRPIIHAKATAAAAQFVARPGAPWVLVVDDDRRPEGWLDTSLLNPDGMAMDVPFVTVDPALAVADGDSISVVFDRILSSPSNLVPKLSADGRVIGVFAHDTIAGLAAEAMSGSPT